MTSSLRIAVADDEAEMLVYFEEILTHLGHKVVSFAKTGQELIENCRSERPDLVVTDIKMPDMDGIDATSELYREGPIAIILVSAYHDPELIERAEADRIMAYLIKPIRREELQTTIGIAMRRFSEFQALSKEAADLRQALEDRKLIERAKGYLMKKGGLDEERAFARLRKLARNKNLKLLHIAQSILTAKEAIEGDS